jgi:hypothetical protein
MIARMLFCLTGFAAALGAAEEYTWWIDPCDAQAAKATACQPGDEELGRWALDAWQRESGGAIAFRKSRSQMDARIRVHWAGGASSLYGETRPIEVEGKRGANIYVLPDVRALGPDIAEAGAKDPLFRDAIVYLTCLHESGHALGLTHTRNFLDIMYSFGYGGDIVGYFQRYRRQLKARADIAAHSGISDTDRVALKTALLLP